MKSYYRSSRCFEPVNTEEQEQKALSLLNDLYYNRRDHYGIKPRQESIFTDDFNWFSRYINSPAKVLEIGSGTGTFAAMLSRAGYEVTAADEYNNETITVLKENFKNTKIQFSEIHSLLNSKEKYDAVISICVLEHIIRPDEAIIKWINMVRPGGSLLIICPNYSGVFTPLRTIVNLYAGKRIWMYRNIGHIISHIYENILLNLNLIFVRKPCFVRCMPLTENGRIVMKDSDVDAVHLPSSRGIINFLKQKNMSVITWRAGGRSILLRVINMLFPGLSPTVRIHAKKP